MKTYILNSLLLSTLALFSVNSFAQLTVTNTGLVGINRVPSFTLDIEGTVRFSNWTDAILDWSDTYHIPTFYPEQDGGMIFGKENRRVYVKAYQVWSIWYSNYSDERIKKNITNLKSSLEKIKMLRGVSYNLNEDNFNNLSERAKSDINNESIGFIAQEVEKVFPQLVTKSDTDGIYGVNYVSLIPVIVEAMKEQQNQIDSLKKVISKTKTSKKSTTTEIDEYETDIKDNKNSNLLASLDQNAPNPFNQSTQIGYYLPETINSANLYIFDMNGLQIRSIQINSKGKGSITIYGSELNAGMYLYTLIADGKEIDTKRMILTQ